MTTKQIAEAVGKTERTVRNWATRLAEKSAVVAEKLSASSPMKPADWDLEETIAIVELGLGRNAAALFRENATHADPPATLDAHSIASIVRETVAAMVPAIVAAVRGVIPERAVAALPAPADLEPRAELRRLVNIGAKKCGGHREAWHELYEQFDLRYHRNLRLCAKNRGIDTLDYAEDEGVMGELLALAYHLFGIAA